MKKDVLYIRYSDHKQDEGYSVEYQLAECQDFMIKNGLEFHKAYIDQAVSGTKVAGRDAFFELLHEVQDGNISSIVVYKFNRLFRNAYESHKYRKLFKKHGVKLLSATQQLDDETSAGRLMINVLADIDQFQSETISDHVKSSMREMARKGYFTGGTVPYGYKLDIISGGKKQRKKYILDDEESAVVKQLFELYAENYSLKYLQDYLKDIGAKTRQGKLFGKTTIARMLSNEFYIGVLTYKAQGYDAIKVIDAVPRIVPPELWEKVQARKKERKLVKPRKKKDLYALTGKIFCEHCGNHFFGVKSGSMQNGKKYEYKYYVCSKRKNYHSCDCNKLRKDFIESYVLKEIKKQILNKAAIDQIATEIIKSMENTPESITAELKAMRKQKKQLEARLDALLEMRLNGEMSAEILKKKSVAIEAELSELLNAILTMEEQQKRTLSKESIVAYLEKMLECAESADEYVIKNIFDHFVKDITVNNACVTVNLIVRPHGNIEYKQTHGHPHITLCAKQKR